MRQTPEFDKVQERMQPGVLTLHGFLGTDTRKLADIIAKDNETVLSLGITHEQIADKLAELTEKGRDIMEREVPVNERYLVKVRDDRGVMPSPFGDGNFGKGDVEMTDKTTGNHFKWNDLCIHMIRSQGFYSGVGSEHRLDPRNLFETLELE
ncbi:MAG: hypothetical protein ACYTFY_04040 [Planctomycetota bacterium]|jgi:hypothetical protein